MPSVELAEPPPALLGDQRPRIRTEPYPEFLSPLGAEAVGLAGDVGLVLDDWEAWFLERSLVERAVDKWAAFEVAGLLSRQNGKGAILEARELAGLFLLDEGLIIHSAHEYKTAAEGFRRLLGLVEGSDMLRRRVRQVRTSHGEEGIELLNRNRLRFLARSGGSGRGFTGDCIILDEAQNLPDAMVEAMMPTVSARPNPQVWYMATAPDRDLAPCDHLARLRRRALAGGDRSLFYAEWSIDPHDELCPKDCRRHDEPTDVRSWARANPGLGIRITAEHVAREYAAMSPEGFAKERLGVGRWPLDGAAWQVISSERWAAALDARSQLGEPVAFAADINHERTWAAIGVAGRRPDGKLHVEVIDHRPRTDWVVGRLQELAAKWRPCALVVDGAGPAGSLIAPLEAAGLEVVKPMARDMAQACGQFFDAVGTDDLRHLDQASLAAALAGAKRRPLSDAWAWARKGVQVDICPLVAVTLAAWGHATKGHIARPRPMLVVSNPDR